MNKVMAIGATGLAMLAAHGGGAVLAQTEPAEALALERIVVVGTRGEPRLATETSAPVDVYSGAELAARGYTDVSKVLQALSPGFNFPRASSGPSSAGARPATLRGLAPDQVLVLVNGRRRHATAIINFNNTVGRGSVPVDYNTIPVSAVERIEILRDGAAAQYGSDAIAGVINIVLKADPSAATAFVQVGETERGDGKTLFFGGQKGFGFGDDGFLKLTGEFKDRGDTNGAEIDPRFGRVTSTLGDPQSTDIQAAANGEFAIGNDLRGFGFLLVSQRLAESNPLFRAPNVSPTFYPEGFLPRVNLELLDIGANAGISGSAAGWDWEVSDTLGFSEGEYGVANSVNTSLGTASPRSFDGGGAEYAQNVLNLTASRGLDVLAGAHLSAGLEHRREHYKINPGDAASFQLSGAQGFPGFNPPRPVDESRDAVSAFVDIELSLVEGLDLGAAIRSEDYSDFGGETTGKASMFWRPFDFAALRATASTGFRAPSLQQQFFSTVTSQLLPTGQLANVGNFAVNDPVSIALGASPLRPETSESLSAGIVLTPLAGVSFSVDAYRIGIEDRISLSENIQGAAVTSILLANGITNASVARFFTNAVDTTSEGWEATLRWDTTLGGEVDLGLSAAYGSFDTDVDDLKTNPVLPQIALLGPASIGIVTDAQPRNKALINANLAWRDWTLVADLVKYGSYRIPSAVGNQTLDGQTALDVSAGYDFSERFGVIVGVQNATDEYPTRQAGDATGRPYSEADPLGFNGREYYVRLTARF